jgi:hypothetical protein
MFEWLVNAISEKSPRLIKKKFFPLKDNASPQTCKFSMAEFKDLRLELLLHPPNSTDWTPSDLFMLLKLKEKLFGQRFESNSEAITFKEEHFSDFDKNFYRAGL